MQGYSSQTSITLTTHTWLDKAEPLDFEHTSLELSKQMRPLHLLKQRSILTAMLVVFVVSLLAIPVLAQETDTSDDYLTRYADIPQSRTEDGAFVLGDPEAPITIVEFADFMCPHCQDYHEVVLEFIDQYVATGQAKFEYRMFPVVSPEYSEFSAQLAECAAVQDEALFWPAHDLLYDLAASQQIDLTETPATLAEVLEIDVDTLESCTETADQFETDTQVGNDVGVSGTPSVLVRLEDGSLGWPFFEGQVGSGGLQLEGLEELVNTEDINELVLVPEPLLESLVSGEPCDAPCWNGITPGKTTYEEAKAIIEENRQFMNVQEQTAPEQSAILLSWSTFDGSVCCQLYTENGEEVDEVFIISTSILNVSEVFETNDEPTHALARETEDGDIIVNLFYAELDVLLYVFVDGSGELELTEESDVVGASYVTDERMETLLTDLQPVEWDGLDALEDYFG
jgi:protein-disulfide isomerase